MPERVQLRRTPGWRKPAGVVVVSRPSRWGNPFRYRTAYGLAREPAALGEGEWEFEGRISTPGMRHDYHHPDGRVTRCTVRHMTRGECVELYRLALLRTPTPSMVAASPGASLVKVTVADVVGVLHGRDLACWCQPGQPCHADVLLQVAVGPDAAAAIPTAADAATVLTTVSRYRYHYRDEAELQEGLAAALAAAGLVVWREVPLSPKDRIDMMVGRVGVEVKVAGTTDAVTRQMVRYAASGEVDELVLVTTRARHQGAPLEVGGKPLTVLLIGGVG